MTDPGSPLRVAIDATPLLDPLTGVGVVTEALITGLNSGPHPIDLTAFAMSWRGKDRLSPALPPGVRVCRRPMAARPLRETWKRFNQPPIEWWTGPQDVVHGPNFVVPPTQNAAEVVTVHDLTAIHFPAMCTDDVLDYPRLLARAIDRGAWVHTVSNFVADEVRSLHPQASDRVVTVANGVTPVITGRAVGGQRLAGTDSYVLALGTVEPRKDLPGLVSAFEKIAPNHPSTRLVIAGADGWGAAALSEAIRQSSAAASITRLGRVTDQQRQDLLAGATLLAYPSIYEGFGLPPLEAMSAGVPVVTTDAGALPEIVGQAALVVRTGDRDELAAAIESLLTDEAQRLRLIGQGRTRAAEFTWTKAVDGLVALYRNAVS